MNAGTKYIVKPDFNKRDSLTFSVSQDGCIFFDVTLSDAAVKRDGVELILAALEAAAKRFNK